MRTAPERLVLDTYPFHTELDTRFGDMDVQGHLNNVALAGLYEEARVRFVSRFAQLHMRPDGQRPMLAEARITYLAEGRYPGRVVGAAGVLRLGRSSYVIGQAMFQNSACIGIAEIVIVWTDRGRSAPLPEPLRAALTPVLIATPTEAGA